MEIKNISSLKIYTYLIGSLLILGCSNTYVDKVDRGVDYKYRPGFPELRALASSFIDENEETYIKAVSEVVYASLVYKKQDGRFRANCTIDYQILDQQNNNSIVKSFQRSFEISSDENDLTYNQDTYRLSDNLKVPPGQYQVVISLTDESTGKQIDRSIEVFVPNPDENVNNVTNIQIFSKIDDSYDPVTTYSMGNDADSVRFIFQITNNKSDDPLTVNSKLIRFRSDTSSARPMNFTDYSVGSIQYKGIDYSKEEELYTNRRVITNNGSILIEFTYPALERGNYRFEVFSNLGEENEIYKGRDFSVKSPSYPTVSSARELAKPLVYLMNKGEYEQLMAIEDENELKKAIDRFWLSNVKNSKTAKSVIQLFYERVEEANKQFSNYKEGWKTDRGMIYILFGPPWFIDYSLKSVTWRYSYNPNDFEKIFLFEAPKLNNKYYPFDHFILQRTQSYYNVQYQQIDLWKTGLILRKNL